MRHSTQRIGGCPHGPLSPDGLTTYLVANADFTSGQHFTFALVPPLDLSDAPASYGTLIANNAARHGVPGYNAGAHTAPLMLGALIDVEADGQPSTAARRGRHDRRRRRRRRPVPGARRWSDGQP